jgi:hypothetical protein
MFHRKSIVAGIAAALALSSAVSLAGPAIHNRAVDLVGAGAVSDPLIAVEANRNAIINRLVNEHAAALEANGVTLDAFRQALKGLRADQLLAASLVATVEEVTAIVAEAPSNGTALQRFVAMTPVVPTSSFDVPSADAYLVREADTLTVVKAGQLQLGDANVQLVGYFVPAAASASFSVAPSMMDRFAPKDGPGGGANSWIGNNAPGTNNVASGPSSSVAGGTSNVATAQNASVGAGSFNVASALNAAVVAGQSNQATGISSLVIGGFDNRATAIDSLVGAGAGHRATGARSVIMGGGYNLVSGQFSMLGGGGRGGVINTPAGSNQDDNVVSGDWSGLLAGRGNRVVGNFAVVTGGAYNTAYNNGTVVGGGNNGIPGQGNTAYGLNSFVGGGYANEAGVPVTLAGPYSVVVGGHHNKAQGDGAVVGGGHSTTPDDGNTASGVNSFIGSGHTNVASGAYAGILTGHDNTASGAGSVALGISAKTQTAGGSPTVHDGAFVFSDGSSGNFRSTGANPFNVLATGGARVVTAATNTAGEAVATAGVTIAAGGGSWTSLSDRAAKRDIVLADAQGVLAKVAAMPVYTWRYITEVSGATHMGPTAQDFRAAFGLGDNDRSITNVDADGVALAAIKGLKQVIDQKDARIERLERELGAIKAKLGID